MYTIYTLSHTHILYNLHYLHTYVYRDAERERERERARWGLELMVEMRDSSGSGASTV